MLKILTRKVQLDAVRGGLVMAERQGHDFSLKAGFEHRCDLPNTRNDSKYILQSHGLALNKNHDMRALRSFI